ncbi:hypothetical protein BDP55DRAFT_377212 [Colletotrichum godetiae]|uniref:Uncharacterized protein n=1 Tax=Colletotrichum godetiae TaxID=1209918 RepID=A0AAJ0ASU2_9PEZI|nr:uncharacterized protein BDP55DRAFT_377212 [Colletotrichum godetiae]KAK1689736.1 hypothetical protein BDP55DRAFT_377212 [Colletotrichum godetiae]
MNSSRHIVNVYVMPIDTNKGHDDLRQSTTNELVVCRNSHFLLIPPDTLVTSNAFKTVQTKRGGARVGKPLFHLPRSAVRLSANDGSTVQLETQRVTLSRNSRNWSAWMRMSSLLACARTYCRARPGPHAHCSSRVLGSGARRGGFPPPGLHGYRKPPSPLPPRPNVPS